jgi:hypothetical protein
MAQVIECMTCKLEKFNSNHSVNKKKIWGGNLEDLKVHSALERIKLLFWSCYTLETFYRTPAEFSCCSLISILPTHSSSYWHNSAHTQLWMSWMFYNYTCVIMTFHSWFLLLQSDCWPDMVTKNWFVKIDSRN